MHQDEAKNRPPDHVHTILAPLSSCQRAHGCCEWLCMRQMEPSTVPMLDLAGLPLPAPTACIVNHCPYTVASGTGKVIPFTMQSNTGMRKMACLRRKATHLISYAASPSHTAPPSQVACTSDAHQGSPGRPFHVKMLWCACGSANNGQTPGAHMPQHKTPMHGTVKR